jgi:hypothetical protein
MTGSANVIPDRHRRMGRIRGAILARCFVLILVLLRNIASHAQRLCTKLIDTAAGKSCIILGPFSGAACCHITELPTDKAAPLQALDGFCARGVGDAATQDL